MTTPDEVLAVVEDGKANRHVSVTSESRGVVLNNAHSLMCPSTQI